MAAGRAVSHRKCHEIMCDQQDMSVEGQPLSPPAERHGPSHRDQSRRLALTRLLEVQEGENVTVPLFTVHTVSALNVLLKYTNRFGFILYGETLPRIIPLPHPLLRHTIQAVTHILYTAPGL